MGNKVLTIVIGTEIIKVCEISYNKYIKNGGIRVYKSISFPTPENVIEDGYIKDKAILCNYLREQLRQAKIRTKKVIFSIASSKIANREVNIPLVKEKRIKDIIKIGASEYFPVDMKDYILSYIILEKKNSDLLEKLQKKRQGRESKIIVKHQGKLDIKETTKTLWKVLSDRVSKITSPKPLFEDELLPQEQEKITSEKAERNEKDEKVEEKYNRKHIRLSVYAVPSTLVKNYYNFADVMGFRLVSIDYSGNSSYQMLKRQTNEGANVFVQLNEQDTVISILWNNVLVLQRTVGYGISSIIDTVMEQQSFGIQSYKEAMELLRTQNLLKVAPPESSGPRDSGINQEAAEATEFSSDIGLSSFTDDENQAKRNVVESLLYLVNSISRMLDYYKNSNRSVEYNKIYLTGFGIRIQGIEELFSERLGIDNKKLEKLTTVRSSKKAREYRQNPSEFMPCIGAVIKPVDFVPVELIERRQKMDALVMAVCMIVLSIGGSGVLCYFSFSDYLGAKADYKAAIQQLEAMPATGGVREQYESTALQLESLKTMDATTHVNERISDVISALKANMLTNSIITSLQFTDTGVVMNVIISDNKFGANSLITKQLQLLKSIELFSDAQESNVVESEVGQISLTITCPYK